MVKPLVENNLMIITVLSEFNADGFDVDIIDDKNNNIVNYRYRYGYNASYDSRWANDKKPYVTDIIKQLQTKFDISNNDIKVVNGMNAFKGEPVEDIEAKKFKLKYLENSSYTAKKENNEVTSSVDIDIPVSKEPIKPYMERISQAVRSEQEAIREYQMLLDEPSLPENVRNAVQEIMNDETDHMLILASLASIELNAAFPDNGDLDVETGEEENSKEIVSESSKLKRKKLKKDIKESVELSRISSDSIEGSIKYLISADVDYDEDDVLKSGSQISDSIQRFNEDSEEVKLTLKSFGAGKLQIYAVFYNGSASYDDANFLLKMVLSDTYPKVSVVS